MDVWMYGCMDVIIYTYIYLHENHYMKNHYMKNHGARLVFISTNTLTEHTQSAPFLSK
jgi:hypothetical protein